MDIRRTCTRLAVSAVALASMSAIVAAAQGTGAQLSPEAMQEFLLHGRLADVRDAGGGVTSSQRATITDGSLTHDVHVQSVDIAKPIFQAGAATEINFKDSYRYNIAGYRLAQLIGIKTVPMSVERDVNGKPAAVTWWVDDVQMDEKDRVKKKTMGPNPLRTSNQLQMMRTWDELIQNRDRNQGNILWTSNWTMWLIDHTRAFRLGKKLLKTDDLNRCERGLFEQLKALTDESIAKAVGDSLTREEREAILARRDLLVKRFEERIAKYGEAAVLF